MSSQKNSYKYTLQVIADILSYENSIETLQQKMVSQTIDWEQFVYVASNYLVLTTCYCRLKEKELLKYLPEDLTQYLEQITTINRNRNVTIIEEIHDIANILNTNNVNYVFLKGSALLIKDYYNDIGERMLGDIDILVEEDQMHTCYQLLIDNGYTGTSQGLSARHFDFKHLPRLQSDTNLAAVEVHRKVLLKPHKGILDAEDILKNKECVETIFVPSPNHLLYHTILNFQANDLGYMHSRISFKSIYDFLVLRKMHNYDIDHIFKPAYFKHYFSIAKIFFNDFNMFKSNRFINSMFLMKLKHPYLRKSIDNVLLKLQFLKVIITSRIWSFLTKKAYRNEVFNEKRRILGLNRKKS